MKIAVLDSGFDFSQPLQNKITNINFTDETNKDENGHGTCIIKLIDSISSGLELYSIKVLDRTGKGKLSSLKVALLEALNSDVNIINLSLGIEAFIKDSELEILLDKCLSQGIIIVTSESNNGKINYLSCNNRIISVQGKQNNLVTSNNVIYINNSPRIIPWLGSSYVLSGANSFLTPFIIKKIYELLQNHVSIQNLKKCLMQQSFIFNSNKKIQRQSIINAKLMKSIEEEISIWNLYDENKAFKIAQATPRNITALVRIIEEKTQQSYIYDSFWMPDLAYLENFVNKIGSILH